MFENISSYNAVSQFVCILWQCSYMACVCTFVCPNTNHCIGHIIIMYAVLAVLAVLQDSQHIVCMHANDGYSLFNIILYYVYCVYRILGLD